MHCGDTSVHVELELPCRWPWPAAPPKAVSTTAPCGLVVDVEVAGGVHQTGAHLFNASPVGEKMAP